MVRDLYAYCIARPSKEKNLNFLNCICGTFCTRRRPQEREEKTWQYFCSGLQFRWLSASSSSSSFFHRWLCVQANPSFWPKWANRRGCHIFGAQKRVPSKFCIKNLWKSGTQGFSCCWWATNRLLHRGSRLVAAFLCRVNFRRPPLKRVPSHAKGEAFFYSKKAS